LIEELKVFLIQPTRKGKRKIPSTALKGVVLIPHNFTGMIPSNAMSDRNGGGCAYFALYVLVQHA
jgi:hypothetical protein